MTVDLALLQNAIRTIEVIGRDTRRQRRRSRVEGRLIACQVYILVMRYQSRPSKYASFERFIMKPLPLATNLAGQVEAIVHYNKLLTPDHDFHA